LQLIQHKETFALSIISLLLERIALQFSGEGKLHRWDKAHRWAASCDKTTGSQHRENKNRLMQDLEIE